MKLIPSKDELYDLISQYEIPNKEKFIVELFPENQRGHALTKDRFMELCLWKSPRPKRFYQKNPEDIIKEITTYSFNSNNDIVATKILTVLEGVNTPVASSILHFCHPKSFPIIDFRALWTLGIEDFNSSSIDLWIEYVDFTRQLANELNLTMRELDRGLWYYSKLYQK